MDYFINQTIHFDSISGLIRLIANDNSTIQLSRPGSRLLTELITHCGNTMTREELLSLVWEEHGLRPSGSNLSNHISLLRKTFSQLDIHQNIIVTVPKKGFRFEAEITLTRLEHHSNYSSTSEIIKNDEIIRSVVSPENTLAQKLKKRGLVSIIIISLIVIAYILTHFSFNSIKEGLIDIGTCRMIDLSEDDNKNRSEKVKLLASLINHKKIDCEKNNSTIYFRFSNVFPHNNYDKSSIFLTQCIYNRKKRITHCESYLSDTIKKP